MKLNLKSPPQAGLFFSNFKWPPQAGKFFSNFNSIRSKLKFRSPPQAGNSEPPAGGKFFFKLHSILIINNSGKFRARRRRENFFQNRVGESPSLPQAGFFFFKTNSKSAPQAEKFD